MRCAKRLSLVAVLASFASPALAAGVTVTDAWFRALPAGLPAGGYFTLHNDTDKDIVLTGAASPACGMVMLHQSLDTGGMGQMKMVENLGVRARGEVAFKPGSYHLMCMQPKPEMTAGATVPVTLEFADGSKIGATFAVKNAKGE